MKICNSLALWSWAIYQCNQGPNISKLTHVEKSLAIQFLQNQQNTAKEKKAMSSHSWFPNFKLLNIFGFWFFVFCFFLLISLFVLYLKYVWIVCLTFFQNEMRAYIFDFKIVENFCFCFPTFVLIKILFFLIVACTSAVQIWMTK